MNDAMDDLDSKSGSQLLSLALEMRDQTLARQVELKAVEKLTAEDDMFCLANIALDGKLYVRFDETVAAAKEAIGQIGWSAVLRKAIHERAMGLVHGIATSTDESIPSSIRAMAQKADRLLQLREIEYLRGYGSSIPRIVDYALSVSSHPDVRKRAVEVLEADPERTIRFLASGASHNIRLLHILARNTDRLFSDTLQRAARQALKPTATSGMLDLRERYRAWLAQRRSAAAGPTAAPCFLRITGPPHGKSDPWRSGRPVVRALL